LRYASIGQANATHPACPRRQRLCFRPHRQRRQASALRAAL